MRYVFNEDDQNGYGFYCEMEEYESVRNTRNECKKQDDNHISRDGVKPGSFFMYCMIREPVKYITVASITCGLTIYAMWILHR